MPRHSVVVVEDDADTLSYIVSALSTLETIQVTKTATDFSSAHTFLTRHPPDILLTDLGLPDGNGIDLIKLQYQGNPNSLIMVLSAFGDEQNVIAAIMAGAKGYLLKNDDSQEICASINQLIDGGSPISASIARYSLVQPGPNSHKTRAQSSLNRLYT